MGFHVKLGYCGRLRKHHHSHPLYHVDKYCNQVGIFQHYVLLVIATIHSQRQDQDDLCVGD